MIENVILVAIFLWFLVYEKYENKEEKKMLIRELTTSLKSKDIVEYKDNVPEYKELKFDIKQEDELIPLEDVDPTTFLRAINKK